MIWGCLKNWVYGVYGYTVPMEWQSNAENDDSPMDAALSYVQTHLMYGVTGISCHVEV